jgi:transcriptional regulator with XRE-family HTH domain
VDKDIKRKIGLKISTIRREKKISQIELAELCDLNFNYISRIELGNANFTINTLLKIANALDCSVCEFFKFEI